MDNNSEVEMAFQKRQNVGQASGLNFVHWDLIVIDSLSFSRVEKHITVEEMSLQEEWDDILMPWCF